jgi:hypothetical protein
MLITQLVGARRDSDGHLLRPNLDFTKAEVCGRVFERGETETLEAFEARVLAQVPISDFAGVATFKSDDFGPQAA